MPSAKTGAAHALFWLTPCGRLRRPKGATPNREDRPAPQLLTAAFGFLAEGMAQWETEGDFRG
ncbi:MAG: hypothetical protein K2K29_06335 [Muribaculaceae bacterium]|nr:hypothetical protein [Muribaculaceae bacterium]